MEYNEHECTNTYNGVPNPEYINKKRLKELIKNTLMQINLHEDLIENLKDNIILYKKMIANK